VKYECQKRHQSEIYIVINDKSQGSIAKHFRCYELLYYNLYNLSLSLLVKEFVKIREHLANLQAKWSIVSCAPFASHHCPQRC